MASISRTGARRSRGDRVFFAGHGYTESPALVQWFATLRCCMACSHCLAADGSPAFEDMDIEMVLSLLDQIAEMQVREFLITGGEPLQREDLPLVIDNLGHRKISWSLNTAAMPSRPQRSAIESTPPSFVAVSLDGPESFHDSFRGRKGAYREAMAAIDYFSSLDGVEVCAGTTVTSLNFGLLDETFHLAAASGADRWGIHLLVPEGRAARRRDLFLSRRQLRRLIRFVSRKRKYFRVEMADEIGYLGELEPMVRDRPLACGAGRTQCVVLPDGEVVPCTTLDRNCSAGNIRRQPLSEIWAEGFDDIRRWKPEGRCSDCRYASACRGGCWLQRKSGTQCFRDVWQTGELLGSTAGLLICLGAASATPANAQDTASDSPQEIAEIISSNVDEVTYSELHEVAYSELAAEMDRTINSIYAGISADIGMPEIFPSNAEDPGWRFVTSFSRGELPSSLSDRCRLVHSALGTESRSLSLLALLWRSVSEDMLEGTVELDRLERDEKSLYIETMEMLRQTSLLWRPESLRGSLIPFIQRGGPDYYPFFLRSKAGPRPGQVEDYTLSRELTRERLDGLLTQDNATISMEFMEAHPYAEEMQLEVMHTGQGNVFLQRSRAGSEAAYLENGDRMRIGVFDRVAAGSGGASIILTVRCDLCLFDENGYRFDFLETGEETSGQCEYELTAVLEAGREYTYMELIREVHGQNKLLLDGIALDYICGSAIECDSEQENLRIDRVVLNEALLWPSVRSLTEADSIDETKQIRSIPLSIDEIRYRARLKESDFWMF